MSVTRKAQEATIAAAERAKGTAVGEGPLQGSWERTAVSAWQPPASPGCSYHLKYGQKQNFIILKLIKSLKNV